MRLIFQYKVNTKQFFRIVVSRWFFFESSEVKLVTKIRHCSIVYLYLEIPIIISFSYVDECKAKLLVTDSKCQRIISFFANLVQCKNLQQVNFLQILLIRNIFSQEKHNTKPVEISIYSIRRSINQNQELTRIRTHRKTSIKSINIASYLLC